MLISHYGRLLLYLGPIDPILEHLLYNSSYWDNTAVFTLLTLDLPLKAVLCALLKPHSLFIIVSPIRRTRLLRYKWNMRLSSFTAAPASTFI